MRYWFWVVEVLIRNDQSNFYAQQSGRRWTRWDEIKTADGPLHSLWILWTRLTINWFTIGWHCWRKGHTWRDEYAGYNRDYTTNTYSRAQIRVCSWCGKYRGRSI